MKALLLLLSLAALAAAADQPSLTGKWNVHSSIAGNESDSACTFTQKETVLTGTCTSSDRTVNLTGKVDGKKVNWSYKSEYQGTPLTVIHEGSIGADHTITGRVSVPEFSVDGDFTATPVHAQ